MNQNIAVYDTTLRDGSQGEGISFSVADKLEITKELDALGIHYIEGGWPGSNPKDAEYFEVVRKIKLRHAQIAAFGSTRHAKNMPAGDPNLRMLVAARTPVVAIFGKSWDLHVRDALRVSLDDNLEMIASSVKFLKRRVPRVFFDAEHFFDGYRANADYAMRTLEAAAEAGADALVLCDTNGGCLPDFIREATAAVVARFGNSLTIGMHAHNDSGLAVANTLAAVAAGARQVQGTINGLGERTGNADLTQIIPNLELKMGLTAVGPDKLRRITETSRVINEMANLPPRDNQPFVGRSAFAHKGGVHVSAVSRNPRTYEHINPETVGNERRILVSELSGRSNILACSPIDLRERPEIMKEVLRRLMDLEKKGYAFENAMASFDLLVRKIAGIYEPRFRLESFRVVSEGGADGRRISEATVKVLVGNDLIHTVSEAEHGPVSALNQALRKALTPRFPCLDAFRLVDYRVHIVNAQASAEAKVRVVIESADRTTTWGTVGVSDNIIEASCEALVDSLEYALLRHLGGKRSQKSEKGKRA